MKTLFGESKFLQLPSARLFGLALLINLISLTVFILLKSNLTPELPLFYSRPEGADQLATRNQLAIIPFIGIGIVMANSLFAKLTTDTFVQKLFVNMAICTSILLLITLIKIMLLVGNF